MKNRLINASIVLCACLATWLVVEGARSLYFGQKQHQNLLSAVKMRKMPAAADDPGGQDFSVATKEQFTEFLGEIKQLNGALGNTDFGELITEDAAINGAAPCGATRPNLDKSLTQIRSDAFNSLDPPVFFADRSAKLSPRLSAFLEKYGFDKIRLTSNERGERVTLPRVEHPQKVIVAGDSVALGVTVSDEFTLASQLQRQDSRRQYINIGMGGGNLENISCLLDQAAGRYRGQISELIYVACDNDFWYRPDKEPAAMLRELKAFQEKHGIKRLIVLRANYVYDNFPFRSSAPDESREVAVRIQKALRDSGLPYTEMLELVREEQRKRNNFFAGLEFYSDHVHWSREGIARMAEKVEELRRADP